MGGASPSPIKRLIGESREDGRSIDCTCGKKTKSVIITDSDHVILSALPPETIAARIEGSAQNAEFSDDTIEGQL